MATTETPIWLYDENEQLVERISWQQAALDALIEENRKLRQTVARKNVKTAAAENDAGDTAHGGRPSRAGSVDAAGVAQSMS